MKKFMIMLTVFAMFFLVSCGGSSKDEDKTDTGDTTADTGDTQTDPADTGDTNPDPAATGDTNHDPADTGDTGTTPDPSDTGDTEEGNWEAKYKKADEHAEKVSADVVKANNDLGMKMFSKLAAAEAGKNMMISPLSISIAMTMMSNGASGDNIAEMKEVLGFGDMEFSDLNAQFADLIQSLVEADKDLVLEIANSVWMTDGFAPDVKQDFIDVLTEFYDAAFFTEDFQDEATVSKINSWVSEKTHGKIDKILENIDPQTVMHLINAIYFKAAWTTSFDKDRTREGRFKLSDGTLTTANYMGFAPDAEDLEFFSYSYNSWEDGFSVIRIPYGRDVFAFYGIVPNEENEINIDDFIAQIAENGFDHYLSLLTKKEFPIVLPKFKFEYSKSLLEIFNELGMEKAFVAGGFDNIAENDLFISIISHKTFIEVNEEGTEAAAVTDVGADSGGDEAGFYAIRPFVFVIRDERNGTILFIGKVENPVYDK